jgi:Protein kinase domain
VKMESMQASDTGTARVEAPTDERSELEKLGEKLIDALLQDIDNNGLSSDLRQRLNDVVAQQAASDLTLSATGPFQNLTPSGLSFDASKWKVYSGESESSRVELVLDVGPRRQCSHARALNFADFDEYLGGCIRSTRLINSENMMIDESKLVALVNSTLHSDNIYLVHDSLTCYAAKLANLQISSMRGFKACGEMLLQQVIFSGIAALFFAFRPSLYCADQSVTAFHGIQNLSNVGMEPGQHSAACKPDGAIRLSEKYYAIAMMELKAENNDTDPMRDPYKCILMTSMALFAIDQVRMEKKDDMTVKTALPFVIGKHDRATLYVTRFVGESNGKQPVVQQLVDLHFGAAPTTDKSNFMATLAILLADIVTICNRLDIALDDSFAPLDSLNIPPNAIPATRAKSAEPKTKKAKPNKEKGSTKSEARSVDRSAPASRENAAMLAASRNGQLEGLHYPWPRPIHYDIDASAEEYIQRLWGHYQQRSPFYFAGIDSNTKSAVFCKVWQEGDPRTVRENIDKEVEFLKLAAQSGVPTVAMLEGLTAMDVLCRSGLKGEADVYHVLVMPHHREDPVEVPDLFHYGLLLVRAVNKLHSIGVLHCDIKPGNVMWDSQEKVVRLVDYGHAQFEVNAKAYPATEGFQAPESEGGEPHTRMSDGFAVGKTLLWAIKATGIVDKSGHSDHVLCLEAVAQALAHDAISARMSLEEAEIRLQSKSGEEGAHHHKAKSTSGEVRDSHALQTTGLCV